MKSYIFGRLWAFFTHWFNPVFNQVTYLFYHWCEYASLIRSCIVLIKHPSSMTGLDLPCLGQGEKTSTSWPIVSWFPDDECPRTGAVVLVTAAWAGLVSPGLSRTSSFLLPRNILQQLVGQLMTLSSSFFNLLVFLRHIRIEGSVDRLSRTSWFKVCRGSRPRLSNFQRRCFT